MNGSRQFNWEEAKRRLQHSAEALNQSRLTTVEELERVYRDRAERFARAIESERSDVEEIVIFHIGSMRFGIPLADVTSVAGTPKLAIVPGSPPGVAGLMQVRGEVRVVWNLESVLQLPRNSGNTAAAPDNRQVLLLRSETGDIGILADRVESIVAVVGGERRPGPGTNLPGSWITPDYATVLNTKSLFEKLQDSTSS